MHDFTQHVDLQLVQMQMVCKTFKYPKSQTTPDQMKCKIDTLKTGGPADDIFPASPISNIVAVTAESAHAGALRLLEMQTSPLQLWVFDLCNTPTPSQLIQQLIKYTVSTTESEQPASGEFAALRHGSITGAKKPGRGARGSHQDPLHPLCASLTSSPRGPVDSRPLPA